MKHKITTVIFVVGFLILMFAALAHAQVGDGVTDDTAALQNRIDKTPARGILSLKADATYNITRPLRVTKSIWIRSNKNGVATTLHCPAMAESWMAHLVLAPRYGPEIRWSEKLLAGQRPQALTVATGSASFLVGYGVNPHALADPAENHYRGFSDSAGLPAPPRDIQGEHHWCKQILSDTAGSIIQDLRFTSAPAVNVDHALIVQGSRGVIIRNVSFDTRSAISIQDSRGVVIEGVRGKVNYLDGQTASGRVLTCWQSADVNLAGVEVSASDAASVFMAEAWCDGISYDAIDLTLRREKAAWPPMPIWFSNGGVRNQRIRFARVDGDLYLHDNGGADYPVERPSFERIEFTGQNLRPDIEPEQLVHLPVTGD